MVFPSFTQLDAMDCGPTSLKIVAQYYGKHYSLQNLRERCHITREGVSLLGISDAAESIGFRTTGVKMTWEQLREKATLPCIVHWNQQHFVVVYKIVKIHNGWEIHISDPAAGLLKYREAQFLKSWIQSDCKSFNISDSSAAAPSAASRYGIALLLEPTPAFYREKGDEDKRLKLGYLLQYLRPYKSYLAQLALAMLTASILSLILPFLTQSVVDKGIGTGNLSLVVMMLVAQVVLTLSQLANNLIRSWLMLHMTVRISISLISDFLAKLMRLPIAFFDSKMVGDIMQRIDDYDRIQSFLTGSLLSMAMAVVSFVIYGAVMGGYDPTILGIFLSGSALYIGWILLFMKRRRKLDYMRFQEAAANQSNIVQRIVGMQDIKLNDCEKQKRWEWERIQARLFQVSIKGLVLGQTQEVGGTFIDQTKNVVISFLAASAVIEGHMTLGMMVALQYIIGLLTHRCRSSSSSCRRRRMRRSRSNASRRFRRKTTRSQPRKSASAWIPDNADIEFRGVTFQYDGPHSAKALDDVSVTIPADKVTAIVGASGSGKTTMLKLMLGFYTPTSGEVLLHDRRIAQYSPSCWRRACGTVMQEGYIFSDTIAGNIGVSDERPDMERVRRATRIANIDTFIDELPLGYNTKIGTDGHGLSVGQKQRLLIARAAYKDAKYLFFDEATNSLDANNERTIMERLDRLFENKTVVVVAHRLSTVRNADKIVMMDRGRIVEQGTHDELTAKRGYYYELVRNQLELGN